MRDIGIDLGTANVLIYVKGEGIVLNEPTVVAIDADTKQVLATGSKANEMLGRTPGKVKAIKPLKDGVIADFEYTEAMLNDFITRVKGKGIFSKPRILICCPSNITSVEKNAIREAAERIGARKVFIEEEPKVAAVGAGMDIAKPTGNMVIDIGGGTTDIAILSLGGIVNSSSIKVAGNSFDNAIIDYVKNKYKLLIGERTAEEIKLNIGNVYKGDKDKKMTIKGRDLSTGLPSMIEINEKEIEESIRSLANEMVKEVKSVLEKTPPELSADLVEKGIYLAGGGALIQNLDKLLSQETKMPVYVANSPLECVAIGAGKTLEDLEKLKKVLINSRKRR